MKISEHISKVRSGEIDILDHTHKILDQTKKINKEYNYFNTLSEDLAISLAKQLKNSDLEKLRLPGVPISIKDAICVKGVETTAGSKILKGYKPLMHATTVQKSIDQGALPIGKTAQDAFGFGSFSVNVGIGFKIPKNPFDKERTCGGSSGGSAGFSQKTKFAHASLGESTGGSIVEPASFCGIYGLCPTYGRVSRYGLLDYGNSLDKIGPMSKHIEDCAIMLETISGYDENDSTSSKVPTEKYTDYLNKDVKKLKVGIIKEAFGEGVDESVSKNVWNYVKKLESQGVEYEEISLELPLKYGIETYYIIACCEASTNLAKYCGMRYGQTDKLEGGFNEYFAKVRSENFNEETKRRIILGTFARMAGYRDAYYIKALKIRSKIIQEYKKKFKHFDALITPTSPIPPPKFSEIKDLSPLEHYKIDIMTVSPNLAGLPHLNVPITSKHSSEINPDLPIGAMLTTDHFKEGTLIQLGKE
ncbi:Asp-tRNA(Asn)/Glu-tRNA(Gln) amidotransferase subunit GatA [Candidatus Woesearchaeota archaeon]|jgi:aspartyl-tRNA(Asn)/glutamyl-tRNA(Gln) amidotransferase subunit A|nr:Asp-tRNA(Asn)/Glu-tRNA(Gln) amidotransferase subunit GatA [Candidatus Woesearchaeota archaeon]MBT6519431.1 Asp-tRNA(Asn)/Glu-tRNA(Gln) amidotransferase subunit GatA [Candidatus Woesearchaeota archaeon]MBT7368908.1 Asp-tRNA(Asn)/Glu-tRNA(Gln) amidotransferase subunit GatA [Candidatus Woesearchaeota archaeon]